MAARGWKLRKDKTEAETSAGESETPGEPAEVEQTVETQGVPVSVPIVNEEAPAVELGTHWQNTAEEKTATPAPDMEVGGDLHFEDEEEPLKLMDYSSPLSEDLLPLNTATPIIAAAPPEAPAVETTTIETPVEETTLAEMPTLAPPVFDTSISEPNDTAGDFTSTLRMSREELASAFTPTTPSGIPPVAPFVLDTPLVAPATEETPPRLVVRMGRLSAAFDLTKEVTVIGRPDSEMHYYPDIEIDLDDAVSRRHAEIIKREDSYSLVDTGSTNGTLLNGETLPAHEERSLTHGDRIRVGERTEIIFE